MKRIGIIIALVILTTTLFILPLPGAFSESVLVTYNSETVKANTENEFFGSWICRYVSVKGITMKFEDLITITLRTDNPKISEEEIEDQIAKARLYMIIDKEHVLAYMGNHEQEDAIDYTFAKGMLILESDGYVVTIQLLADGNLQMINSGGTYIFEKIQEEAEQTTDTIQADAGKTETDIPCRLLVINDDANLLNDDENKDVLEAMKPLAKYTNVGFYTYQKEGKDSTDSATQAANWGSTIFGNEEHVVIIIDKSTRHLDIYASRQMAETLNAATLNSIASTANLYAVGGEYGECACATFKMLESKLKGSQ